MRLCVTALKLYCFQRRERIDVVDSPRTPTVQTAIIPQVHKFTGIWQYQTKLELLFIAVRLNRLFELYHETRIRIPMYLQYLISQFDVDFVVRKSFD